MYSLFNWTPTAQIAAQRPTDFNFVKEGLLRDLNKVLTYYRESPFSITNGHFLVKLISSVIIPFSVDYLNYVDMASDATYRIANTMRMTSVISRGQVFPTSSFYGRDVREIIIATDEDFNIQDAVNNWRELEPVRVLRHPFADLSMAVPKGNYPYDDKGLAVIAINIPMLALQYRRWIEVERQGIEKGDMTLQQFCACYPIPNMMKSHLDVAVFNRLDRIGREVELAPFRNPHPFQIADFSGRANVTLSRVLTAMGNVPMNFAAQLKMIPMVVHDDLLEAMTLPNTAATRQIIVALLLARWPLISFLLRNSKEVHNNTNKSFIAQIILELRILHSDGQLKQALPPSVVAELEHDILKQTYWYI